MQKIRAERWLKYAALILVYSSFLTPWLTQTFLQNIEIRFRYMFGDLVIRLGELPPNLNRTYLDLSPVLIILVIEMLLVWLSLTRFVQRSGLLVVTAAIIGLVPVVFTALNFLKVGFSAPQDFQMTLQPGFFFALGAALLLLISYVMKARFKATRQ